MLCFITSIGTVGLKTTFPCIWIAIFFTSLRQASLALSIGIDGIASYMHATFLYVI
ncbi:hypothetical protein J3E69DRAFT_350121 [Trichoderma sp. SZMC 28015]